LFHVRLWINDYKLHLFFIILVVLNYFTEKDTARKRKRGRACRKIAPILERTTTSNSQTENSKVAPPSTVKGKE